MADINSRAVAKTALRGLKMNTTDNQGVRRTSVVTTPAAYAAAVNDVLVGPVIPKGSRILGVRLSCGPGSASSTCDISLRSVATGAISVAPASPVPAVANGTQALAAGASLASATVTELVSGTYVAGGVEMLTTEEVYPVLTFLGAAPPANQQIRVEVGYTEGA